MKAWAERDKNVLRRKIELLQKAKKYLKPAEPVLGLCYAVGMAKTKLPREWQWVSDEVGNYIRKALQGELWLQNWIKYRTDEKTRAEFVYLKNHEKLVTAYRRKMYETRIAWIDWMIEQYQQQLKEI